VGLGNNENTSNKLKHMTNIEIKKVFIIRKLILIVLSFHLSSCTGQVKEKSANVPIEIVAKNPLVFNNNTTFPQIHTNLNGMVREFVRSMYQDTKGNYWFGTNGSGIIRYDGTLLEKMNIERIGPGMRVLSIVEDKAGNVWFGTSEGLIKYDGKQFTSFAKKEGLPGDDPEIWGLTIDKNGLIWVGSIGGVSHFDGEKFTPFLLPETKVEDFKPRLSDKLVFKIMEDRNGTMWFSTDGNGIFKYKNRKFTHLTKKNGLTDDNAGFFEDYKGNIWIGTLFGGTSKFDGTSFTNFTKDGIIKGEETGAFLEDRKGNIWFTAENVGVYKYDGTNFTLYTTENGLTANLVLSIYEDNKGQLWFGTWQGMCIFDGEKFGNANIKEPWTK
jgi:ligand-binding sensor domain-containing protein